jgi:hypothetical protein
VESAILNGKIGRRRFIWWKGGATIYRGAFAALRSRCDLKSSEFVSSSNMENNTLKRISN